SIRNVALCAANVTPLNPIAASVGNITSITIIACPPHNKNPSSHEGTPIRSTRVNKCGTIRKCPSRNFKPAPPDNKYTSATTPGTCCASTPPPASPPSHAVRKCKPEMVPQNTPAAPRISPSKMPPNTPCQPPAPQTYASSRRSPAKQLPSRPRRSH